MHEPQERDQQLRVSEVEVSDGREGDGHEQRADEGGDVRGLRERELVLHHHLGVLAKEY